MAKIRLQGEEERKKNIFYEVDTDEPCIGEGGMGKVMKGICVDAISKVSRPVAIKFLFDDLPQHAIERAKREASIQLRNDNLVEMLGFIEVSTGNGTVTRKHYHVVSELLHGVSLSNVLEGNCIANSGQEIIFAKKLYEDYKKDPVHFAKVIVTNVLNGLVALHDAGYVHRDIDPSNIMITDDGHIKLIDFGIAKQANNLTTSDRGLTTAGAFMGKAEYAAPELAVGDLKHQNRTTDIYAMGILLYQCVVGHVPFEGPTHEVLDKQLHKKIPLAVIKDRGIRNIIECATDKNQNVRYQTASQMRVAMEHLDGKKKEMKKSTKIIISSVILSIIVIASIFSIVAYNNKQKKIEMALQVEKEMNDSLRINANEFIKSSDASFLLGEKHDEGFENAYIDAYNGYEQAIETLGKITSDKPNVKEIEAKKEKTKKVLLEAQKELEQKAKDFESEDMPDIADEFHNRAEKIINTIK